MRESGVGGETSGGTDAVRAFRRRDAAALGSVALLVVLNQAVIQPTLLRLLADAPAINEAGRQRMLSQRLAKAVLALDAAGSGPDRTHWGGEVDGVLKVWSAAHERLRAGVRSGSPFGPAGSGPDLRAAFEELEPSFTRMRDAARRARDGGSTGGRGAIADVLAAEADYLPRMDRIVGLYEREARSRVDRLILTGWALTGLVLAALVGIGRFILAPAERTIARQLRALVEARGALEDRVRERTAELEQTNRELAREALERSRAEERHRALLEQLDQAGRTATVGEMAGGLAHELNQPLGAIANYVEGSLVALDASPPALGEVRGALGKALAATLRAGEIVQRVRRFVTRQAPTRERTDPDRLVRDVEGFLRDELARRSLAAELDLAPGLPYVWCDPVQVQQVLVNLIRNAADALNAAQPPTPELVISARRVSPGVVEFAVSDNGEGIPADRIARVFDAYFSTRDDGMGMGLAISRSIVEAHRGKIGVESLPGVRTTFRFTLPTDDREDEDGDGGARTDGPRRGR